MPMSARLADLSDMQSDDKTMKSFYKYIVTVIVAAGSVLSCTDPADEVIAIEPILQADKDVITADATECVTLTVTADGEDVTSRSTITVDGLRMNGNTFATVTPGRYAFKAVCDGVESNTISVEAIPQDPVESQFVKNVAVFEFTGAWCTFCPSGYSNMNFVISRNDLYRETVHIMAFHSGTSGPDELAIPETDKIMTDMNVGAGFPSFLTELRTSGGLSDGNAFKSSLAEAFEENPSHCGVAVESDVTDGKINVVAKVYSEMTSSYRMAVFVVEDNIKYYQKDGSLTYDEYNHRHVVRSIASASYMGDRLGDIKAGEQSSKTYEIALDSSWNLDNTYIYALAIDHRGTVNNMCICPVNGNVDFNRI